MAGSFTHLSGQTQLKFITQSPNQQNTSAYAEVLCSTGGEVKIVGSSSTQQLTELFQTKPAYSWLAVLGAILLRI